MSSLENPDSPTNATAVSPPRAFTQGVGTVFQFTGIMLFLLMLCTCFLSGLLSREVAGDPRRLTIGWHLPSDAPHAPTYSYAKAITVSVTLSVFFGIALTGIGLGLQAQRRDAPKFGIIVTGFASAFWLMQAGFAIHPMRSILLTLIALAIAMFYVGLLALAIGAYREMRATPPPMDQEILPMDFNVPYSHMHQDPPEVRLAAELKQRREKLAIQQKELEKLEDRINRKH